MKILDCTLRDGSYAINFQFTSSDTVAIASALEKAGLELIEVGHGVGLNASKAGHGEAAESDESYLKAAAGALKKARFGMFCIPGIARLEDVDMASHYGMGFIRIGTNVTEVNAAAPFIERARKHGMFVCSNLMKSYALPPSEFGKMVKLSASYGSQTVYVVDSSGGMMPQELSEYVHALQDNCEIPWGFHAHNNLGLAVSNSLLAMEYGASIVDTSLQGMGRGSGNAATELLVSALVRMGKDPGLDLMGLFDAGETFIRPLIRLPGFSSLDVVCGVAQFHSSYMRTIRKVATECSIDPRLLILEVAKVDKINAPEDLVRRVAGSIQPRREVSTARYHFEDYYGEEQSKRRS